MSYGTTSDLHSKPQVSASSQLPPSQAGVWSEINKTQIIGEMLHTLVSQLETRLDSVLGGNVEVSTKDQSMPISDCNLHSSLRDNNKILNDAQSRLSELLTRIRL